MQFIIAPADSGPPGALALRVVPDGILSALSGANIPYRPIPLIGGISIELLEPTPALVAMLTTLARRSGYDVREASQFRGHVVTNNSMASASFDLGCLEINEGYDGSGIDVGIIDGGFDASVINPAPTSQAHLGSVAGGYEIREGPIAQPELFHGTFCASLIRAVAPKVRLHTLDIPAAQCLETGLYMMIDELMNNEGKGCKVINASMRTCQPTTTWDKPRYLAEWRKKCLLVAAIGNEGKGIAGWPAACAGVLSVGALVDPKTVWPSSGSTSFDRSVRPNVPLVVAPGVNVFSPALQVTGDGSSLAAPLITGMAALLFQACPGATVDLVEAAILRSARQRNQPKPKGRYEYGVPSFRDALAILQKQVNCGTASY